MRNIAQRTENKEEFYRIMADKSKFEIRVAVPGIVQSFNANEQTVTVQPAIRERVRSQSGAMKYVALPLLLDVPVVFPRAGGYVLTMPVAPGDECLVIFGDSCMDAWWSSGGVQNPIEKRRHDLSDGYAIMGTWSQPRKISNYSTNSAQLRTEDGTTHIGIQPGIINLDAATVNINVLNANINASGNVNVVATKEISISGEQGVTIQGKTQSQSW